MTPSPLSRFDIVHTKDGSPTVVHPLYKALYHSHWGAVQESQHIFIREGLDILLSSITTRHSPTAIRVFEMGFGTGLNALLAYRWSKERDISLQFHTIEQYPIPVQKAAVLNYPELLSGEGGDSAQVFLEMHKAFEKEVQSVKLSDTFAFFPLRGSFFDLLPLPADIDIVFWDAFAPGCQPELWTDTTTKKVYDLMRPKGILVTFCAQGAYKRTLRKAGFTVVSPPGPPGKREMTRAIKTI